MASSRELIQIRNRYYQGRDQVEAVSAKLKQAIDILGPVSNRVSLGYLIDDGRGDFGKLEEVWNHSKETSSQIQNVLSTVNAKIQELNVEIELAIQREEEERRRREEEERREEEMRRYLSGIY